MTTITSAMLRHRLTIQQRSTTRDTLGQENPAGWTDFLTVWADIAPTPGISQLTGEAQVSSITHTITIRYRPGVAARMRAVYGSRIFEIDSVVDMEERHFWLRLNCIEGISRG